MTKRRRRPTSFECCVVHEDGTVSDAEIHEPILDNPEADLRTRTETARRTVAEGMFTQAEAEAAYHVKLGRGPADT